MGLLTILKKVKQEEREVRILVLGLDNAGKTTIVKRLCGQPIDKIEPTLGFSIQTLDYKKKSKKTEKKENSGGHDGDGNPCGSVTGGRGSGNNSNNSNDEMSDDSSSSLRLHLWDIGGQSTIRAYWRNYFEQTDGLIWVVDSSDVMRLELVAQELQSLLKQEKLEGATLLIFANKIDLVHIQQQPSGGDEQINGGVANCPDSTSSVVSRMVSSQLKLDTLIQYENRHWNVVPCSAVTSDGLQQGIDWLVDDIKSRLAYC